MKSKKQPDLNIIKEPVWYAVHQIEPITFIMKNDLPFHVGNIVKYATRAGLKIYPNSTAIESEILDLKKVMRYAEMRINQLEGKDIL